MLGRLLTCPETTLFRRSVQIDAADGRVSLYLTTKLGAAAPGRRVAGRQKSPLGDGGNDTHRSITPPYQRASCAGSAMATWLPRPHRRLRDVDIACTPPGREGDTSGTAGILRLLRVAPRKLVAERWNARQLPAFGSWRTGGCARARRRAAANPHLRAPTGGLLQTATPVRRLIDARPTRHRLNRWLW